MGRQNQSWGKSGKWQYGEPPKSWSTWSASHAKPKAVAKATASPVMSDKDVQVAEGSAGGDAGSKLQAWAAQQGVVVPQDILQAIAPAQDLQSKAIQKAANHLRKVELRVRGVRLAMQNAEAQWKAFQRQVRESFAKQLQSYQSEMCVRKEKLAAAEKEEKEAKSALEAATAGLTSSVNTVFVSEGAQDLALPSWLTGAPLKAMDVEDWEPEVPLPTGLPGPIQQQLLAQVKHPGDFSTPVRERQLDQALAAAEDIGATVFGPRPCAPQRPTQAGILSPSKTSQQDNQRSVTRAMLPFGGASSCGTKVEALLTTKNTQYRECGAAVITDPYLASPRLQDLHASATPPSAKHRRTPRSGVKESAKPSGPMPTEGSRPKASLADHPFWASLQGATFVTIAVVDFVLHHGRATFGQLVVSATSTGKVCCWLIDSKHFVTDFGYDAGLVTSLHNFPLIRIVVTCLSPLS